MPIDSRCAAGVRHDSSVVHLDLNAKVNDIRSVVTAFWAFWLFWLVTRIGSQGSDRQRSAGENEVFLNSWSNFHTSSGRHDMDTIRFVDGVNTSSALFVVVREVHIACVIMLI